MNFADGARASPRKMITPDAKRIWVSTPKLILKSSVSLSALSRTADTDLTSHQRPLAVLGDSQLPLSYTRLICSLSCSTASDHFTVCTPVARCRT